MLPGTVLGSWGEGRGQREARSGMIIGAGICPALPVLVIPAWSPGGGRRAIQRPLTPTGSTALRRDHPGAVRDVSSPGAPTERAVMRQYPQGGISHAWSR